MRNRLNLSQIFRLLLVGLLALIALTTSIPSIAQESPPEIRIARLVKQLGSEVYAERKQADEELAALGFESRRQLELATQSTNAEIRLRATDLLKRIKLKEIWLPGQAQLNLKNEKASKALSSLMEQTGNHILRGDSYGAFHDADVSVQVEKAGYWATLDDLCRQSGNHIRPNFDVREPGLVVVAGPPGKNPVAYAGPLRAQVTSARRVFIEELDHDDQKSDVTHTFQINFQMMWEDRLQLVAYRSQPDIVEAITDTKVSLTPVQSSNTSWNVAGSGTRQLTANLRLSPPPAQAKQLDKLVLKWGLVAVGDFAAIDVTDLNSKENHCQDDVQLVVEEFEERSSGRYDVTVLVTRDLAVPDPQDIVFQENRFELFDDKGHSLRSQGQSNVLTDRGARQKLTFTSETGQEKPKVLRLTYPRLRSQQEMELTFRNVPLPSARPE